MIILCLNFSLHAQTFVKPTATGTGSGTSWDNAIGQSGLESAVESGGTVYVAEGTYNITNQFDLSGVNVEVIGGYPITSTGTDLSGYAPIHRQTIFDGTNLTSGSRMFDHTAGSTTITLKGLVLQNASSTSNGPVFQGRAAAGGNQVNWLFEDLLVQDNGNLVNTYGAFYLLDINQGANSSIVFRNCDFTRNLASTGGAIRTERVWNNPSSPNTPNDGDFVIDGCSFFDNAVGSGSGGAIEFRISHRWTILNSTFCDNSSRDLHGGAIHIDNCWNLIMDGCSFGGNQATGQFGNGGAIHMMASSYMTMSNSTFVGNDAVGTEISGRGGAIYTVQSGIAMTNCGFYNNVAYDGGAMYTGREFSGVGLVFANSATDCIFSANQALNSDSNQTAGIDGGGAICNENQRFDVTAWTFNNNVFANNTVPSNSWGGAIADRNGNISTNGDVFFGNRKGGSTTTSGADIKIHYSSAGNNWTIANSDMQLSSPSAYTNVTTGNSYNFTAGNSFSNTTGPSIVAPEIIDCGVLVPVGPNAENDVASTIENTPLNIDPLVNDDFSPSGPNSSPITIVISPSNGVAIVNDGGTPNDPTDDTIDYTPDTDYIGFDSIDYQICNANNDCDIARIAITVLTNPCIYEATAGTATANDPDGDGINNECDEDNDNDGILDAVEGCYIVFTPTGASESVYAQTYTTSDEGNTFQLITTGSQTSTIFNGATQILPNPSSAKIWPNAMHYIEGVSEMYGNSSLNLTIDDVFPDFNGDQAHLLSTNSEGTSSLTVTDPDGGQYVGNQDSPDFEIGYADIAHWYFQSTFIIENLDQYDRIDFEHREYIDADMVNIYVNGNAVVDFGQGNTTHTGWETDPNPTIFLSDIDKSFFVEGTNILTVEVEENNSTGGLGIVGFAGFGRFFGIVDTDGDGIANCLDLDSDNDGCPDYIEGAGAFTDTDGLAVLPGSTLSDGNGGMVTTNLGTTVNGDSDSAQYGVPTVAGSGQAIGMSQDSTNAFACLVLLAVDDADFGTPNVVTTTDILANDDFLPNNDPSNIGTTTITDTGDGTAAGTIVLDPDDGTLDYTPINQEAGMDVTIIYEVCNDQAGVPICDQATVTITVSDVNCDGPIDCENIYCGQIQNREFNTNTTNWNLLNHSGNLSTLIWDQTGQLSGPYSARVEIVSTSGTGWHTQLEQSGIDIVAGATYLISFSAKADGLRDIEVMLQQNVSPFDTYFAQTVQVANNVSTYVLEFTASTTVSDIDLTFNLGHSSGLVWIDAVQLKEACPLPSCVDPTDETFDFCSQGVQTGDVSINDNTAGEVFATNYSVVTEPSQGTLSMDPDGTFSYTPTAGAAGTDSFIYERCYELVDDYSLSNLVYNPCGTGITVDTYIEGIENETNPSIQIANPSDFESIVVEVWAERACGSVTIEGVLAQQNDVYRSSGSLENEKIYRATITNVSSDGLIDIVKTGGCPLSSAIAYVSRIQTNGQGSSTVVSCDVDLYQQHISNGDDCHSIILPIGASDAPRDLTITVPIHEKDDSRVVTATATAGAIAVSGSTSSYSSIGQGAGEIVLTLAGVPSDAVTVTVEVCSPDDVGDSFGMGAISINNLVCQEPNTLTCCAQATAVIDLSTATIANSNPSYCPGEGPTTLTVTDDSPGATFSYQWSHSTETTSQLVVNPASTSTYTVTVTNEAGCSNIASTTVIVHPNVTVSIDYNGSVCLQNGSQLTAVPTGGVAPYNYTWSGPNSFSAATETVDITDSGAYNVTVTDANGCVGVTSGFVNDAFEPTIISLASSVCDGETVDLEVTGSNISTYAWGANAGNATTSSVTVTPVLPSSTYVVTVTSDNGCTASSSITVDVEALPIADAGPNVTVCENTSITISTTDALDGTIYAWDFGTDATPSTGSGPGPHSVSYSNTNSNGSNSGNTVVLTATKGDCVATDTKGIVIRAEPKPTVTFSDPSCGVDDGSITFTFVDNVSRTNITFSINGGVTYPYNVNDNAGTYTINNLGPGTYDLHTVWGNGQCPVSLATVTLADNEVPVITNTGSNTICIESSTGLTASTSGTWSSDNESVATVSTSGLVLGVSAGIANISFVADNNCPAAEVIEITVENKAAVTITGDPLMCEGETSAFSASSGGGSWQSSDNSVVTVSNAGVVTAVAAGSANIQFIHPSNSCSEDASFAVTVPATPSVFISGPDEICVGETTTLSTDQTGGFWTSSDTNVAIVSNTGAVSGVAPGDATFFYTSADGCPSSATGLLAVTPAVGVAIDLNGSSCLTDDSQLSAIVSGGTAGYSYAWTGPGGFTGNTQTVDISLDGNYSVVVTDSKGCSDQATAFVYESYEPFILGLNTTVCDGDDVTLEVNGSSAVSYQWSASAGGVTSQSVTVTPALPSTIYSVTVTNSIGCTSVATADIMVEPRPVVSVTGPSSICVGETTQLSPDSGGSWTSSNNSVAIVNDAGVVTAVSAGSAVFTFEDNATGCTSDATAVITIAANAPISISGTDQICFDDSPQLTASVPGGNWSSVNNSIATIDANGVITPMSVGSTSIIYTMDTGCYQDGTYDIVINGDPTLSLNGGATICEGDNTYATASLSGVWSSSDEDVATISQTGVITGVGPGSAIISFTTPAGCTSELESPITVIGIPSVELTGPGSICINTTTTLSPSSGGIWISSNNSVATVNGSGLVMGQSAGTASFTFIEGANGCVADSLITVTVEAPPVIGGLLDDDLCIGESTSITPSTGGTWQSTNTSVATIADDGTITAVGPGTARFTFTNSATGCASQASVPLMVNENPSISFNGPTTLCVQETSVITASSAGLWSSTDVTVAMVNSAGEITATGPGTVQFFFTSDLTGCTSDLSSVLTVEGPTAISLDGPAGICMGDVTNLLPASGGNWISSDPTVATISNSGEVVGVNPGIVTFTFDSNTGCPSEPSTEITIYQVPTPTFIGPSEVCIGSTTTVGPASGGTWTSTNTSVATIDDQGNILAVGPGVAQFTYLDSNTGCEATTAGTLSVYEKPVPEIIGDDNICIGFSTYLLPNSGGVWTSNNPSVAIISAIGQVTAISAGTATFTFYENGSTCESEVSQPVTVSPRETATISGPNNICVGGQTNVLPNTGGSWISSNDAVATVDENGRVTAVSQGIARFTFISDAGCASNQTSPVIVYGPPTVSITGDDYLCVDSELQMQPSTGGSWTSSNDAIATITDQGVVTGVSPGLVRFTFTDGVTGCMSAPSDEVTINAAPNTDVNGPAEICAGGTTYMVPSSGGVWTSTNPAIATIQNNGQVSGVSVGEVSFIFTQLNTGCVSDTSQLITVNGGPDIDFAGPTTICVGETTSITPSQGGTWQSTNPLVASISNNGVITAHAAGSVKFRFTETASGCASDFSETLTVNGLPMVGTNGSPFVCIGSSTQLSPSTGGTWQSLNPDIATVTPSGLVSGVASGEAYFVFTDTATGCQSDGNLSVTVRDEINAEVIGATEICTGYTTVLSPSSGGVWTSSNPKVARVSNFGVVTGLAPGVVTFTFTDSNTGCTAGGTTEPITVSNCINHDFNVAMVGQTIQGNLNTNDNVPTGSTYSSVFVTVEKPNSSLPTLTINPDGSYTFVTNRPGKYRYRVSVCVPPATSGCPSAFLEINVISDVYATANPVANLEFSTTYADVDPGLPGDTVTIDAMANDRCVLTGGCALDTASLVITDAPQNGTTTTLPNGTIQYIPNAGFVGHDTIFYEVCVVGGTACSESMQVITVSDPSATNSIVAADDFAWTMKGVEVVGDLSQNDIDPEGDAMIVTQQGSLINPIVTDDGSYYVNNDGTYGFTPNEGFSGSTEIIYTICDDAVESVCTDATLHIQVFDDLTLQVRVYLEGALMQNDDAVSVDGRPLMRDGLRQSIYDGQRHIPARDPYTYYMELFDSTPDNFTKKGPGMMPRNHMIVDSTNVFAVTGDNAIVDWIFVEIRDKQDARTVLATRSGLLQRDGDIVDIDGVSPLRFQGVNADSFYVAVRHRIHLGVMSEKVANGQLIDFTSPDTPTFDFGTTKNNGVDYTGLAQKSSVKSGYMALWAGNFNSDGQVKFTEPASDPNILYVNVLFTSPEYLINYDFTYGYYRGDYNMDGKAKFTNPDDDKNYLLAQIIFYRENKLYISNYGNMIEQIPNHE